jgi:RNA polymerase sigma-54 factor
MKQSLHLGLGQQLRMTPQLQQAIRLLQLSTLELEQEIQETLYNNPILEIDEQSEVEAPEQTEPNAAESSASEQQEEIRDVEFHSLRDNRDHSSGFDERFDLEDTQSQTLQEYLLWQLNLTALSQIDKRIGEIIIDAVDQSGFLSIDIAEIKAALGSCEEVDEDDILAVLHRIQRFDPLGVASRNLNECLSVQLNMLSADTEGMAIARTILDRYLELLPKTDLSGLAKRMRKSTDEVESGLAVLKSLNPKPGYDWSAEAPDYIIPDLVMTRIQGGWVVSLNSSNQTRLRINPEYVSLAKASEEPKTKEYLRSHLQEARWFIRSLESRNDTLLRVARAIIEYQADFFDQGPEAMRPLILRDLAEKLELHESTISRATSNKYLMSPRGMFELKYFFSSQLSTTTGGEASSTAIRALISRLIKAENPAKPLSDNQLTRRIEEQGIKVARRTVAKYRELEGIPPSSERRRISVA